MGNSIDTMIANATAYADGAVSRAHTFLNSLAELATIEFDVPSVTIFDPSPFNILANAYSRIVAGKPDSLSEDAGYTSAEDRAENIANEATEMPSTDIPAPGSVQIPTMNIHKPSISIPSPPSSVLPPRPSGAPNPVYPNIPNMPEFTIPDLPEIIPVVIPSPPSIGNYTFDAIPPADNLILPTDRFHFDEREYVTCISCAFATAGFGVDTEEELAMWERAKDREIKNALEGVMEASRKGAVFGWQEPPGAVAKAIQEAEQKGRDASSTILREIGVKRADLIRDNNKFKIEKGLEYEKMQRDFHIALMERALNVAKLTVQLGIEVYNSQVNKLQVDLDVYKTRAQVFEILIRSETNKIEIYKVELEGAKINLEVQKLYQELYKNQIEVINILLNMYRLEMEAANLRVEIDKAKVDLYKALVSAYAEEVRAKEAEFGMFDSQIRAEKAKVDIYEVEVKSYATEVEAKRTEAEVLKINYDSKVEEIRLTLDKIGKELEIWKARLESADSHMSKYVDAHRADLEGYIAQSSAYQKVYELATQLVKSEADTNIQASALDISNAQFQLTKLAEQAKIRVSASAAGADVYKGLALGALSAINTLVELYTEESTD